MDPIAEIYHLITRSILSYWAADCIQDVITPERDGLAHLPGLLVLAQDGIVLQLQVGELLLLPLAIPLEDLAQVANPVADLFLDFEQVRVGRVLHLADIQLQVCLGLLLGLEHFLQVGDVGLFYPASTYTFSMPSLMVVLGEPRVALLYDSMGLEFSSETRVDRSLDFMNKINAK